VVELNGVKYVPKKNIETYLFIGVDCYDKVKKIESYDDDMYQCDTLILMVRDISQGTFKTLAINRNTLTNVKTLDVDGTYLGETEMQLAFAHASGDGMEISCENTVEAVSEYLGGQKIDGYAAVNMGAISIINNLAGGVTVTIEDDFSQVDSSLKIGETVTLTDEQAVNFVRGRWGVGDETNENRMNRQNAYMEDLKVKLREKCQADNTFPLDMYDALGDYMVTNISSQKFAKLAMLVVKDKDEGKLTIDGTVGLDEFEFATFEPDQESLNSVIAELFYKKYE
jgi:anionic cell wall polymer biosynthesis LytR-Cps2A-Psr (LCP) family protein